MMENNLTPYISLNSHRYKTKSKMKLIIVLSFLAIATAAPPRPQNTYYSDNDADILRYENDNPGLGTYRYYFEQSDGTKQEQQGELRNEGREDESLAVKGSYTWIGPDGLTYVVTYTADEDGFKPEIDQPPGGAVPPAVVASLLG